MAVFACRVVVQDLGGSSMEEFICWYLRGEGRIRNGGPPRKRGRTAGGGAAAKGGAGKPVNSCTMARKLEVSVVSTVVGGRREARGRFLAGFVRWGGSGGAGGRGGDDWEEEALRRPWKEESRYRLLLARVEDEGRKILWWWEVNSWSAPASALVGREGEDGRLSLVDAMDGAFLGRWR
jgi:hypothetical protein